MMHYVKTLREYKAADKGIFGNKAANLSELLVAGFNVPDGFCVTAGLFDEFVASSKVRRFLDRHLAAVRNSASTADYDRNLIAIFESVEFPELAREEIGNSYASLPAYGFCAAEVAVRSSCTIEDSTTLSFAGQFVSTIGVQGIEDILAAIKRCYVSAYSSRVLLYLKRMKRSITIYQQHMAVLVQELLHPEFSGVLFTAGVGKCGRDTVVIEFLPGATQDVVEGQRNPGRVFVDKRRTVITRDKSTESDLAEELIKRLVIIALDVEEYFGCPQDVEWAIDGGSVYVLQSRPITAGR